ncbi:unnamed protein product [Gongylonema pulchrum]|uniref:Secreted protein n=1 Tax=Gongylonema pulchrum TaxID=637853 RepID=A0A183D0K3_9BILA|nr:unnamed protein product [Gongylonema pulchrum]
MWAPNGLFIKNMATPVLLTQLCRLFALVSSALLFSLVKCSKLLFFTTRVQFMLSETKVDSNSTECNETRQEKLAQL